jgi:oleate hydratase
MKAHLVGGGLASMAAAAYLIREAGVPGSDIFIYDKGDHPGGSLRIFGNPTFGYVYPGGRVFEREYRCAFDLFSFIPSHADPARSIKDEILEFNAQFGWDNRARLIDGDREIVPQGPMGVRFVDRLNLLRVLLTPDRKLQGKRIQDCVSPAFFKSEFWYIWSSIMAFRPRHGAIEMRRYMLRFMHLLPELWSMTFILRTKVNQHQAIVEPLAAWLTDRGVNILGNRFVSDIIIDDDRSRITANELRIDQGGRDSEVPIAPDDLVFVTNGSPVFGLTMGSMDAPPAPAQGVDPWTLWRRLAEKRPQFGDPSPIADHIEDSHWVSFTVTDHGPRYAELMEAFTGREAGRGGLVTFRDSNWFITVTRFHHPNVVDQPADVFLWWGYGIYPERPGNFIKKPMTECNGAEILQEVLHHLKFEEDADDILRSSTCIPCLMPYAASLFLWRTLTDRPRVVPQGSTNLAFIGQYCEQPGDVPFTMEYSVRSARTAVHTLTGKGRQPPPIYRGYLDPRVLFRTAWALQH